MCVLSHKSHENCPTHPCNRMILATDPHLQIVIVQYFVNYITLALFCCCGHSSDNVFFDHYGEVATLWVILFNQDTPPIHAIDNLS